MKKIATTILLLMAVMMTNVQNADAQWTTANLSVARSYLSAATVGTKVFFTGGADASNVQSSVVDIYDNSTGLWSTANLSVARSILVATAVGTKVFFAGGGGSGGISSVVDIYDNSTGLWTTANLSGARSGIGAAAIGTKVFFAGGVGASGVYSSVVDIYDNGTGLWTTANLSAARAGIGATAVGTKVFFAGGASLNGESYSVVDIFDNSTGLWTTANLSEARSGLRATTVGTKVFFAGGRSTSGGLPSTNIFHSVVDIYDNSTGLWTTANLSQARAGLDATAVGNKVFFAGGSIGQSIGPSSFFSVVDIYDNSTGLWTTDNLSQSRAGLGATAVGTKAFFAGGGGSGGISSVVDIYDNTNTGINESNKNEGIKIYPNPTTDQLTIALPSNNKKVEVTITDITGKIIYSTTATDTQKLEVNTNDFAEGIYVVQIQAADFIGMKKLVVEK